VSVVPESARTSLDDVRAWIASTLPPLVHPSSGPPVIVYPYLSEEWELLFVVARFQPKAFAQARLGADGAAWTWRLGSMRRVPYALPWVLAWIADVDDRRTLGIAEGEKCVEAIIAAGGVATCNPGGAGKWQDDYAELLAGAHPAIAIVADQDRVTKAGSPPRGLAHAVQVRDSLARAAGVTATIVRPPRGKDAADALAAGCVLDELYADPELLLDVFYPPAAVSSNGAGAAGGSLALELAGAGSVEPQRVTGLHGLRVLIGKVTVIAGEPKLGKSLYALLVVLEVVRAGGRALIVTVEDDLADTILPRLIALGLTPAERAQVSVLKLVRTEHGRSWEEPLVFPEHLGEVSCALEEQRRLADEGAPLLLVVDPLGAHLSARVNSWNEVELRRALAPLQALAADALAAALVVAHLNKATGASAHYRVAGSIGLVAAARSVLMFTRDPTNPDGPTRLLAHSGNLASLPTLRYRLQGVPIHVDDGGEPIAAVRLELVGEAPEFSFADLGSRAGASAGAGDEDDDPATELEEAVAFITGELAFGPRAVAEVNRDADALNIKRRTLERARKRRGVEAYRAGGLAGKGRWMLRLPLEDGDEQELAE
jgi:putative DNA primase/helicase